MDSTAVKLCMLAYRHQRCFADPLGANGTELQVETRIVELLGQGLEGIQSPLGFLGTPTRVVSRSAIEI